MTQFNLFIAILEIITQLLEVGADASTTHEARQALDALVAEFYESEGVEIESTPLGAIIHKIATKRRTIPQELKGYFLVKECFEIAPDYQLETEIFFRGLPSLKEECSPEESILRVSIFIILNDLLQVGINSCSLHESHMKLDALLEEHEHIQQIEEERKARALDHLFPNLKHQFNSLTIISKSEGDLNASF